MCCVQYRKKVERIYDIGNGNDISGGFCAGDHDSLHSILSLRQMQNDTGPIYGGLPAEHSAGKISVIDGAGHLRLLHVERLPLFTQHGK